MAAYVIYQCEVTDLEGYERYRARAGATVAAVGGRYIVRGGDAVALEGEPPASRTVVIEFPDRETALAWYHDGEYAEVRKLREHAATARMYVVDGVD